VTVKKKISSKRFSIKCSTCEEEFSGPSKLISHARDQHQDLKPFKCSDCSRCYQNPKALKVHKRSHETEKRFKCLDCKLEFHVKANLISHSRVHSGEKFHCECRKSFSSLSYLKQHQLSHNENAERQLFTCKVSNCGKTFPNSAAFRSHSHVHSDRRFSCSHCEKSFKTRPGLTVHLVKHSIGDAKSFQCHVCGWTTIYRQQYYEHIKAHTAKRDLECFHCSKKFTKKSLLILHMQTHLSERNFICNIDDCRKAFKTYNSCYAHKRKHQNSAKKYNCASCDKVFSSQSVLLSHVKAHTGESFTCHFEGCSKSYAHKQNLNMHLLTAHVQREKVFECEICQKILSNSNALRVHLAKVHKSEKIIECPLCVMKFASIQLLDVHKKQIHQPKMNFCKDCNYGTNYKTDLDKHITKCHQQSENENK
jgi:KRAB domain-containing zinc finger protein